MRMGRKIDFHFSFSYAACAIASEIPVLIGYMALYLAFWSHISLQVYTLQHSRFHQMLLDGKIKIRRPRTSMEKTFDIHLVVDMKADNLLDIKMCRL